MRKSGNNNALTLLSSPPPDESLSSSLSQLRDVHATQLPGLRIAPLRQPVPRRIWNAASSHFPLKPEITAHPTTAATASTAAVTLSGVTLPERLPILEEYVNAASTSDTDLDDNNSIDPNVPLPPKTILPAFINLQTVEKLPYLHSSSTKNSSSSAKRRRIDVLGDHFVSEHLQLPVPQAQNEKKLPPFGPFAILNGLNEPPPNAALFPPIEPALPPILTRPTNELDLAPSEKQAEKQADKRELRLEEILDPNSLDRSTVDNVEHRRLDPDHVGHGNQTFTQHPVSDKQANTEILDVANEPMSPKTRGRSRKNLRKWTEQETTDLLKGVVKCGIGNWTAILQQPELNFNKRSAANLKDRFRVCCPWAYGAADPNEATKQIQDTLANALMKAESLSSGAKGKILLPDPRPKDSAISTEVVDHSPPKSSESLATTTSKQLPSSVSSSSYPIYSKSTPAQSLKSKSTLSSLGISEPYFTIKSKRRSRRPFTPAEDEALLKGYAVHGFQWTLIQQDRHLNLSHRRATDLRDRFRTKFPNAYREGGSVSGGRIGSLRRETSNDKDKDSPNNSKDQKSPTLNNPQHPISILPRPPPPALSSVIPMAAPNTSTSGNSQQGAKATKKKRNIPPEPTGLAPISSLLPPPVQLGQSGTAIDPPDAPPASASANVGAGATSSLSFSNLPSSTTNHNNNSNNNSNNNNGSFNAVPSLSTTNSTATANPNINNPSWEDNTLPPLNWDDLS